MKILKYIKIYLLILKISFMNVSAYRINFFIWAGIHLLSMTINFIFFSIVFSNIPEINGWNFHKTLILLGTVNLFSGIGSLTFFPFMYDFSSKIHSGKLDMLISKPIDIQFLASFPYCDIEDVMFLLNALIIFVYAIPNIYTPNFLINLPGFFILIISSCIIIYSIITLFQTLAFKAIKIDSISTLIWNVVDIGKYPVKIFEGTIRIVFMLVIPAGLLITVPAEVLLGIYDWKWIVTSLVLAATLFTISRKVFLNGLKHYSSASS
ncbi:ABC transporter permease [Patescibacteria group bacterium]